MKYVPSILFFIETLRSFSESFHFCYTVANLCLAAYYPMPSSPCGPKVQRLQQSIAELTGTRDSLQIELRARRVRASEARSAKRTTLAHHNALRISHGFS